MCGFWADRYAEVPQDDPGDCDPDWSCSGSDTEWLVYAGGPLVIGMSDTTDETVAAALVPVHHDLNPDTQTCRKCKRGVAEISQDPDVECLLLVDFSAITRGMV